MDGAGRALHNVYVERLWRSLKYEDIYLNSYESTAELRRGVDRYFRFYNTERFHQGLYATPETRSTCCQDARMSEPRPAGPASPFEIVIQETVVFLL